MNPPKKIPDFLQNTTFLKKITIIDHTETSLKDYLPNTNSYAIETTLTDISTLSEHFIYFNDDIFLCKNVYWYDFFDSNGNAFVPHDVKYTTSMLKNNNIKCNFKTPSYTYKMFSKTWLHIPYSFRKSCIKKFIVEYSDFINFIRNIKSRKNLGCNECNFYNLKCPCQFLHYTIQNYMYLNKSAKLKEFSELSTYIECRDILKNPNILNDFIKNPTIFLCINDTDKCEHDLTYKSIINTFFATYYNN